MSRAACDDGRVTRRWELCVACAAVAMAAVAVASAAGPLASAAATAPPTTIVSNAGPIATNDLLPANNDLGNCVGLAESANCGSRSRADGHTYLVFLALAAGLAFIGWRIGRGVRARDAAPVVSEPQPNAPTGSRVSTADSTPTP
jgi:hypothetical protein